MIILALGTNIEPREEYLTQALKKINETTIKIKKVSSIYETPAWGGVATENFLNMCIVVEYKNSAYELLDIIQKIELELGRIRKEHWGNRTIDIDIIEFDNKIFNDDRLIVPHKFLHERNFVLLPIFEMCGDIDIDSRSIRNSLEKLNDDISVYKKFDERILNV